MHAIGKLHSIWLLSLNYCSNKRNNVVIWMDSEIGLCSRRPLVYDRSSFHFQYAKWKFSLWNVSWPNRFRFKLILSFSCHLSLKLKFFTPIYYRVDSFLCFKSFELLIWFILGWSCFKLKSIWVLLNFKFENLLGVEVVF